MAGIGLLSFSVVENVGTAFDVWDKAQLAFGWKLDALEISRAGDREQFTRDVLQLAFRRWYLARNLGDLISVERPAAELDEVWRAYEAASLAWEELLVVNRLGVDKWYGTAKAQYLEQVLEPIFTQVNWCMIDLRSSGRHPINLASPACKSGLVFTEGETNVVFIRALTNTLYLHLHCFAAGVAPPEVVARDGRNAAAMACPAPVK